MSLEELKEPILMVLEKFRNINVDEFFAHYFKMHLVDLQPEFYGCKDQTGLIVKFATELGIVDLTSVNGSMIINLSQGGVAALRKGSRPNDEFSLPLFETADELQYHQRMVPDDAVINVQLPSQELPTFFNEDSCFPVVMTQVESPARFWVNIYTETHFGKVTKFMDEMDVFYGSSIGDAYKIASWRDLELGCVLAARYKDGGYHRATLLKILPHGQVSLCYLDYGTVDFQRLSNCRYLRQKWSQFPGQALEAHLYGILPAEGRKKFTNQSRDMLVQLTNLPLGTLYACVRSGMTKVEVIEHDAGDLPLYEKRSLALSLYDAVYGANGLDIGDKLVQLGHASAAEMTLVDLDNDQTTVAATKVHTSCPLKVSPDKMKTFEAINKVVAEKDDFFIPSEKLKLLRLHEKNLKAVKGLLIKKNKTEFLEDIAKLDLSINVISEQKEKLETEEATKMIDEQIIPNLPKDFALRK